MTLRLERLVVVGLLMNVMFAALAFGAVEPWAVAVSQLIIAGLVLLWGASLVASGRVAISVPKTALPIAALCLFGLIQGLAFRRADGVHLSLSVDVEATRAATMGLFFLLIAFVIAANVLTHRGRVKSLVITLTIFGLLLAVFALAQHFTWNGRFYWLRQASIGVSSPFGPFANHNHFAGYMELLIPLPVALVLTRATKPDSRLFLIFAATVMAVAAVVSLSRGGMISLAAEMGFLCLMSGLMNTDGKRREGDGEMGRRGNGARARTIGLILVVAGAIAAGIYWTGPERVIERLAHTGVVGDDPRAESFRASRGWVWRGTLAMISANPLFGVGLGAYETAYPLTSIEDVMNADGVSYTVDRAHNDYLQALADCGIVGGILVLWFIVLLFRRVMRATRSGDALTRAMALGGGAGLFALLVHSLVDFNLQLQANALLFLIIAAVVSQLGEAPAQIDARISHRRKHSHPVETADQFATATGVWSK